jgi:hypothetical protein
MGRLKKNATVEEAIEFIIEELRKKEIKNPIKSWGEYKKAYEKLIKELQSFKEV